MLGTRGSGLDAIWERISLGRAADGGGSVLGRTYLISSLLLRFSILRRRLLLRLLMTSRRVPRVSLRFSRAQALIRGS